MHTRPWRRIMMANAGRRHVCTAGIDAIPKIRLAGGRLMPALGLGTWNLPTAACAGVLAAALQAGYRHIDCAAVYRNEAAIGAGLQAAMAEQGVAREDLWITSKLWNTAHHPDRVRAACEQTLADLRLAYLDLYLMHWPVDQIPSGAPKIAGDPSLQETPLWATFEAMHQLQKEGLVRAIGVSNFSVREIRELTQTSQLVPEVNQVEVHPYLVQPHLTAYCKAQQIVVTAYSPLGSAKAPPNPGHPVLRDHPVVRRIAEARHRTPAQILLRWSIQQGFNPIPKTERADRLRENIDIWDFELTAGELQELSNLDVKMRFCAPAFHTFREEDNQI